MKLLAVPFLVVAALFAHLGTFQFRLDVLAARSMLVVRVEQADRSTYALTVDNRGVRMKHDVPAAKDSEN